MFSLNTGVIQGYVNYVAYDDERESLRLLIGLRKDRQVDGEWEKAYETIPVTFFGKMANTYADFDLDKKHVTIEFSLAGKEIDKNITTFVNGYRLHVSPSVRDEDDDSRQDNRRSNGRSKPKQTRSRVQSADDDEDAPPWER